MKKFDLRKWREKYGLSQVQAANELLLSRATIQNIEAGLSFKNLHLIEAFCYFYDKKKAIK